MANPVPITPEHLDPDLEHEVIFYNRSAAGRRAVWPFDQMEELHWFRVKEGSYSAPTLRTAAHRKPGRFSVFHCDGYLYVVRVD